MGSLRSLHSPSTSSEESRREHLRDLVRKTRELVASESLEERKRQNEAILKTSRLAEARRQQNKSVSPSVWNTPITI